MKKVNNIIEEYFNWPYNTSTTYPSLKKRGKKKLTTNL
jgi:hypothetical protein